MIINSKFRIRKLSVQDVDFATRLRSDFSVNSMLGDFIFIDDQSQLKWIESIDGRLDMKYFIFEIFQENKWQKVGLVRINHIDFINRSASVGGDIIKDFRGKGLAKEMFKLIFQLCFDYINLNRLWLFVLENNNVAINLYTKIGFIREGVQRKAIFRDGQYLDYIMMSLLKNEYKG